MGNTENGELSNFFLIIFKAVTSDKDLAAEPCNAFW